MEVTGAAVGRSFIGAVPSTTAMVIALGSLFLLRVCFDLLAGPMPDEAYYWIWGQHLDLSYFDHPPLLAWTQRLMAELAGWNLAGLRLATWLTTAGTLAVIAWYPAADTGKEKAAFLPASAVFFACPVAFIFTTITFPDHLVIFLGLLSVVLFAVFFESAAGAPRIWALYAAAVSLGLAGLAKYNAVFIGVGVIITVLATRRLRPLLASPHLYAAAALSIAMQTPVIVWNLNSRHSSFEYNLWDRLTWRGWGGESNTALFLIASAFTLSPFLIAPLFRFLGRQSMPISEPRRRLGRSVFIVSTAVFTALCQLSFVQFYWNLPAYLTFLPTAWMGFRSQRAFIGHLVYGVIFAAFYTFNYTVLPLGALVGVADAETAVTYGWDEIGQRVMAAKAATGAQFVATSDYRTASLLGFAIHDSEVTSLSDRKDQFGLWLDEAALAGKNAVILPDDWHPLARAVTKRFAQVELIATFPLVRLGHVLKQYQIYRGVAFGAPPGVAPQGFRPDGAAR
jgi:hypothetical protein